MKKNMLLKYFMFLIVTIPVCGMDEDDNDNFSRLRTSPITTEKSSLQKFTEHPVTQIVGSVSLFLLKNGYKVAKWGVQQSFKAATPKPAFENIQSQERKSSSKKFKKNNYKSDQESLSSQSSSDGSDSETESWKIIKGESTESILKAPFRSTEELTQSFNTASTKTLGRINETADFFYLKADPEDIAIQVQVHAFTTRCQETADQTKQPVKISEVVANKHNPKQYTILDNKIKEEALILAPRYKKRFDEKITAATTARDKTIAAAHKKFTLTQKSAEDKFALQSEKMRTRAKMIAEVSAYLNNCSTEKLEHIAHDPKHYESLETYRQLLETVQQTAAQAEAVITQKPIAQLSSKKKKPTEESKS